MNQALVMKHIEIIAATTSRADSVLRDAFSGPGKRFIKRLFEQKRVRHNGKALKKGDVVEQGERILIESETELSDVFSPVPEEAQLTIVHESDTLLIVDKPANVPSLPLLPGEKGTLANALVHHNPALKHVGNDPREAGLANRLDAGTTGLVVVAKTTETWLSLRELFSQHKITKEYITICESKPLGTFNDSPLLNKRGLSTIDSYGLPARTDVVSCTPHGEYWKVVCSTRTGRMHQIRAHLAALSAPLVGDVRYGAKPIKSFSRHALHGSRLMIPQGTKELVTTSSLPDDMMRLADV